MRWFALVLVATVFACAGDDEPIQRQPGQRIGDSGGGGGDGTAGDPSSGDPAMGDPWPMGDPLAGDPYVPPVGPCSPNGSGTVTGSVQGYDIDPVNTAGTRATYTFEVIALTEYEATSCFDDLEAVKLLLTPCDMATGVYTIVDPDEWDCVTSPSTAWALMEEASGTDIAAATAGSITVTSVTDACATGSFSLTFDTEPLSGTFDAQRCPL